MNIGEVCRAPVVSTKGDLVGMVTTGDLLGIVAGQLSSLARLIGRQPHSHGS